MDTAYPGNTAEALAKYFTMLCRYVIPIFTNRKKKPVLIGTGFLISSEKYTYLVSAAHVFDHHLNGEKLFIYVTNNQTIELAGKCIVSKPPPGGSRIDDKADVGVIRLAPLCIPQFPAIDKISAPFSWLQPQSLPREGKQYLITGYPSSKSKASRFDNNMTSEMYTYRNLSISTDRYPSLQLHTEKHIAIGFDENRFYMIDGTNHKYPAAHGLSGSPLWLLYNENGDNDSHIIPIVGVVIEHRKNDKIIVSTDIEIVSNMIQMMDES